MSRPDRWWRPATNRRPPLRARQRRTYSEQEMGAVFDTGYACGQGDERKNSSDRDDALGRLADACDDPAAVEALAREVGVMPPTGPDVPVGDGGQLVDEVERWLRDQG